jgi:hypothetical protein
MRTAIIQALRKQGYRVKNGVILMPEDPSKDDFRALNTLATQKKLEKSGPGVKPTKIGSFSTLRMAMRSFLGASLQRSFL